MFGTSLLVSQATSYKFLSSFQKFFASGCRFGGVDHIDVLKFVTIEDWVKTSDVVACFLHDQFDVVLLAVDLWLNVFKPEIGHFFDNIGIVINHGEA